MSVHDAMQMTLPQLMFFCYERMESVKTEGGQELKNEISKRYATDKQFRDSYSQSVKDAIQRAKDSLVG